MQMALALSKSTYIVENPDHCDDVEDLPTFINPEKIPRVKTTLERYGFKSDRPKLGPELRRDKEFSKKSKTSKFRFITPTLKVRTEAERASLIASKISLILNQNKCSPKEDLQNTENIKGLSSDYLKQFITKKNSIVLLNGLTLKSAKSFDYYVKQLNLSPAIRQCGSLLKNWDEIPGRETSPDRSTLKPLKHCDDLVIAKSIVLNSQKKDQIQTSNRDDIDKHVLIENHSSLLKKSSQLRECVSPDLFESDNEFDGSENGSESNIMHLDDLKTTPQSPEPENVLSQSLLNLSPSKSPGLLRTKVSTKSGAFDKKRLTFTNCDIFTSNTGVKHFESYCNNLENLSQQICDDVAQDSEDDDTENLYLNTSKNMESVVYDLTQSSSSNDYNNELECNKQEYLSLKDADTEFDMSPLHVQCSVTYVGSSRIRNENLHKDIGDEIFNRNSPSKEEPSSFESSKLLNVTDYVNEILTNHPCFEDEENTTKESSKSSRTYINLSQESCSQESIIISDEELNYSSMQSKEIKNKKFYDLSDIDDDDENDNNKKEIRNIQSGLTGNMPEYVVEVSHRDSNKNLDNAINLSQQSCSQESIIVSDEELDYSIKRSEKNKDFYGFSDDDDDKRDASEKGLKAIKDMHSGLKSKYQRQENSVLLHNRVSELKAQISMTRESLARVFFEESFTDFTENADVSAPPSNKNMSQQFKLLQSEEINKEVIDITPEKYVSSDILQTNNTPENNFIIKTKNITPMMDYEQLDTPGIIRELQNFGLKPLKRQRGVKLLKYLYEATHPNVDPNEIHVSSDEDDQRTVKRRKKLKNKINDSVTLAATHEDIFKGKTENIDLMDNLIESENMNELIFERKYSIRIPSCRVPLQIVWHNFVCCNPQIKENILLYEPLQLEVVHSMLKEQTGCKFHIQDLLAFFDKKCITIRTGQIQGKQRPARR
ncbi:hypothetical protein NQ317_001846 [Molorchus minor]|uniref:Structure-specific endonuclease subunit SLX4 n=1 Tax=Molorchus minor TaxID=1323400 RepID=A0ABQ9JXK8_9CUCU|nr:hypothetical protein NQ317_001846 [Molorchus minor]